MELFESTRIGQLEVKNHFIRSATYEGKATEDGKVTPQIKSLYEDFALGQVGTIITSYTYISDYEQPAKNQLGIYKDELIDDWKDVIEKVHQQGSKMIMQIVHGSSLSQGYPDKAKVLGPSAIKHPKSDIIPQEMSLQDIQNVIQLFVEAGKRVKKAGFDGVQIHCAHGYLLAQFISPLFNKRQDNYGGSVENRVRIVVEIYRAMRKALGDDYPIWIKMNLSDEQVDGLTNDDFIKMAKILSHEGIDAIEISGEGWNTHSVSDCAYFKDVAMKLSQKIKTPLILTGGLRTLEDILPIYEHSHVQFFGFARPFIRNHHFIKSLKTTNQ